MKEKYFYPAIIFLMINCFVDTVSFAQSITKYESSQGFVAHEWGTFTTLRKSNGDILSGLEREEVHLPQFAYNICFCYNLENLKALYTNLQDQIINVTVKMETPVIYFYSSENIEKRFSVDVKFKNGSISQWYPNRRTGELATNPMIFNDFQLPGYSPLVLDFSVPRLGWIQWKGSILPLSDKSSYTNDYSQETPQWIAPRKTESNLVKIDSNIEQHLELATYYNTPVPDQIEKFLFYRGIGNFQEPIRVEFNNVGNLVITNSGQEQINYFMVYEKRADGTVLTWGSDSLPANRKMVIQQPKVVSLITTSNEIENFTRHLISAGLYEDEARAMLKTWEESYFQHEGLKVFWIVPPKFTDDILPLQIDPVPDKVKRVLVGRSEILTPEFEEQLSDLWDPSLILYGSPFYNKYSDDRFFYAYQEAATSPPTQWTDYNVLNKTTALQNLSSQDYSFKVFPNPVTGNLTININEPGVIKIFAANGELIYVENAKAGVNTVNTEIYSSGMYNVKVEYGTGLFDSKKIIKQ